MKITIELDANLSPQLYPQVQKAIDVLKPIALKPLSIIFQGEALKVDQATNTTE